MRRGPTMDCGMNPMYETPVEKGMVRDVKGRGG